MGRIAVAADSTALDRCTIADGDAKRGMENALCANPLEIRLHHKKKRKGVQRALWTSPLSLQRMEAHAAPSG